MATLAANPDDIPFAILYLLDSDDQQRHPGTSLRTASSLTCRGAPLGESHPARTGLPMALG